MGLVVDEVIAVVVEGIEIANRLPCGRIEVVQLVEVAGAQVEPIDHLGILAGVERVLAVIARVAQRGGHAIGEGDLAVGDLEVAKSLQSGSFEGGKEKEGG